MTVSQNRTIVPDSSGLTYLQWPNQPAGQTLDYSIDLSQVLSPDDAPASIDVRINPSGSGELTASVVYATLDLATITMAGGVPGRLYQVSVNVTTTLGCIVELIPRVYVSLAGGLPPIPLPPVAGFGPATSWTNSPYIAWSAGIDIELENAAGVWKWG